MSDNVDWETYYQNTETRYLERYQSIATDHAKTDRSNFTALDVELPNLMATLNGLIQQRKWKDVIDFALKIDSYLEFQGRWTERIHSTQAAIKAAEELKSELEICFWETLLGTTYRNLGHTTKAIEHHERALSIALRIGNKHLEGDAIFNLGKDYHSVNRLDLAMIRYERALKIIRETGDQSGESSCLSGIGNVFRATGEYMKAIEYYQESIAISCEIGERSNEGADLGNMGTAFRLSGNFEKAIFYYDQAHEIAIETGDRQNQATWLLHLGESYRLLGQQDLFIEYSQKSLTISREIGDLAIEQQAYSSLKMHSAS